VHAFVGLRAFLLPSRQGSSPLLAPPYFAYFFLPPLFPLHASCLILSLHFDTGNQQGIELALVLRSSAVNEPAR
jgi:hypothetical protein